MAVKWSLYQAGSCRQLERLATTKGRWRWKDFPSLCTLIEHPTQGQFLYDTGYETPSANTRGWRQRLYHAILPARVSHKDGIKHQLSNAGKDDAIQTIILSHFHIDHIGGIASFPHARFICRRADYEAMKRRSLRPWSWTLFSEGLPADFEKRMAFVEDFPRVSLIETPLAAFDFGYDLTGDGQLIAVSLPGHTAGHLGLYIRDEKNPCFLIGDASWSLEALRSTSLPSRIASLFFYDHSAYNRTLHALAQLYADAPDLAIVPSHCSEAWARYGGRR